MIHALRLAAVLLTAGAIAFGADEAPVPASGDRGYALTVLSGDAIEQVPLKFIGTFEDFAGPGYDLHLVQLEGSVAEHVGVAAGMSGSPVYIDGTLIGALSYRLGAIPRDAIAGVTPIADILDAHRARGVQAPGDPMAAPIGAPLVAVGLAPDVRKWLEPQLEPFGLVLTGGGRDERALGDDRPFEPGSPIGVGLVRGDLTLASTGTVTWVDGDRVYAFGHPFFGTGRTEMPMHRARVVHTLADMLGSQKLATIGAEVGAIVEDRLTAIVGLEGVRAGMMPMRLDVHGGDYGDTSFAFEVVRNSSLAPLLSATAIANAMVANPGYNRDGTIFAHGIVRLRDLPELPFELAAAGHGGSLPSFAVAGSVAAILQLLWNNPFEEVLIESIHVDVEVRREVVSYSVESLLYDRGPVAPGDVIRLSCVLERYRGERETREFAVEIPASVDPRLPLMLAVGTPERVERAMGNPLSRRMRTVEDPAAVVRILAERRGAHRLTALLYQPRDGVVTGGAAFADLPPTARRLLSAKAAAGGGRPTTVAELAREEIALDGPVDGGVVVRLPVEAAVDDDDRQGGSAP